MTWLIEFADAAGKTDRLVGNPDHTALLAAGLMGEAGSVLTELKKQERELQAYPAYRRRMLEEVGDFLWYFVRLVTVLDKPLLDELAVIAAPETSQAQFDSFPLFLEFGAAVGDILAAIGKRDSIRRVDQLRTLLGRVWKLLCAISREARLPLKAAADGNLHKIESRWPTERVYVSLFDSEFSEEEQLPRQLDMEFRERSRGEQKVVILRCNGINFGDRLTDNIHDPDGYRYHDIFHFAHAVHLGWSPVVRALLRCKRKSNSKIDEAEDGARAVILEEAASAIVFARAKQLNYFDGLDHLDYDLLKTVSHFVEGYEVERVPLWQWEAAIIDGYSLYRKLRNNCGGRVILNLEQHQLTYIAGA